MKKINSAAVCYGVSALLFLGFIVNTMIDYSRYNGTLNSAPFSVWVVANVIYFVIPATVVFVIGLIIRKKVRKS